MKKPLSVIIITKDPKSMRETQNRFDTEASFPRLTLLTVLLKAFFTAKL